jgi:4-hydroxybenzoate polyprenyltransferase
VRIARGADLLFSLRPLLWVPAVALYEAGRIACPRAGAGSGARPLAAGDAVSLGALLLLLGSVHAANAWEGRASDRENRKGWPVASGAVGGGALLALAGTSLAGAVVLAAGLGGAARALLACALALGVLYTAPGIALKRRAGFDLLANALGYGGLAFALGGVGPAAGGDALRAALPAVLVASTPYALGVAALTLLTMIADLEGDERSGARTTAVVLGLPAAARFAGALAWGTAVAGLWTRDLTPALWGTVIGAGLGWEVAPAPRAWNRTARAAVGAFLLLLLCSGGWLSASFAAAVAPIAAIYHRSRTGSAYPLNGAFGGT